MMRVHYVNRPIAGSHEGNFMLIIYFHKDATRQGTFVEGIYKYYFMYELHQRLFDTKNSK